jgi:hypothetical protein
MAMDIHIVNQAHVVARLVRLHPGETPGSIRRRLAGRDRVDFVPATVQAVELELIEVREGKLHPGANEPLPGRQTDDSTAAALDKALEEAGRG